MNETEFIVVEEDQEFFFINNLSTYISAFSTKSKETDLSRAIENAWLMGKGRKANENCLKSAQRWRILWWEIHVRREESFRCSETHAIECNDRVVRDNFHNHKTIAMYTAGRGWYDDGNFECALYYFIVSLELFLILMIIIIVIIHMIKLG